MLARHRVPLSVAKKGRGSLEQVALLAEPLVLAPQPRQLSALISRDTVVTLMAIDLVLATPVAQRLLRDAHALRQLARRPSGAQQLDRLRRNSGGEAGRVLGTTDTILSRPDGASHQTSAKPGPLHRAASRYCGLVCGGERGARMAASSSTANAGAKTSSSIQAQ